MNMLSGLKAHLWQRISAYFLTAYFPLAALYIFNQSFATFTAFQQNVLAMEFLIPSLIAVVLLLVHIWVGVRDIFLDYLPRKSVVLSLMLLGLAIVIVLFNILYLSRSLSMA